MSCTNAQCDNTFVYNFIYISSFHGHFLYIDIPYWAVESTHAHRQKKERSNGQQDLMLQKRLAKSYNLLVYQLVFIIYMDMYLAFQRFKCP